LQLSGAIVPVSAGLVSIDWRFIDCKTSDTAKICSDATDNQKLIQNTDEGQLDRSKELDNLDYGSKRKTKQSQSV
jgi:hypothetical protein